jgi:hypothetical protein
MRKGLIVGLLLFVILQCAAQPVINLGNRTLEGRKSSSGWIFEGPEDTILAFEKKDYAKVMKKLAVLQEEVRYLEKVVQASEDLREAYEDFECKADSHIVMQKEMIKKADRLYTGYRDLYDDLEDICVPPDFSVLVGSSIYRYRSSWKPLLNLGVGYRRFQGVYHLGKQFNGVSIQYRLWSF